MRVISKAALRRFWERYPEAKGALTAWHAEAKAANWMNPAKLKAQYGNASILRDSRVVFNICGNKYRLVVKINYFNSVVFVRFIGTHDVYDSINAEVV